MTTCGPLFKQAFEYAEKESRDVLEFFSWGHLTGQAEKVWLGSCTAFMVRSSNIGNKEECQEIDARLSARVHVICSIFSLDCRVIKTERGDEYWVFRRDKWQLLSLLSKLSPDSEAAHFIRGTLCGVPPGELDLKFHERYGDSDGC